MEQAYAHNCSGSVCWDINFLKPSRIEFFHEPAPLLATSLALADTQASAPQWLEYMYRTAHLVLCCQWLPTTGKLAEWLCGMGLRLRVSAVQARGVMMRARCYPLLQLPVPGGRVMALVPEMKCELDWYHTYYFPRVRTWYILVCHGTVITKLEILRWMLFYVVFLPVWDSETILCHGVRDRDMYCSNTDLCPYWCPTYYMTLFWYIP
jgi:hypothetical protein